jgi:hypothetical protein
MRVNGSSAVIVIGLVCDAIEVDSRRERKVAQDNNRIWWELWDGSDVGYCSEQK